MDRLYFRWLHSDWRSLGTK